MIPETLTESWTMDSPATYLIRIHGNLDVRWIDYFHSISIAVMGRLGSLSTTTICAHDADQADLLGILNSLYNFGYPLLGVERVKQEDLI